MFATRLDRAFSYISPARVDKQECAAPGWVGPRRNLLLAESFRRCTRCESFGQFCLVHLAGLYVTKSVPSACSHTALGQNARSSEKKVTSTKYSTAGGGICRLCRRDPESCTLLFIYSWYRVQPALFFSSTLSSVWPSNSLSFVHAHMLSRRQGPSLPAHPTRHTQQRN